MSSDKKAGGFKAWLVRLLTRFLFLLVIFIAGALTMHFGMHADDHDNQVKLQATIDAQSQQINQLKTDLTQLQSNSSLEQGAQKALEEQITGLQQELTDVRDKLSFYEQLVPPGPAGSINIRAFTAEQKDDVVDYRVLLTRNVKSDVEPFNGQMRFTLTGKLAGKKHQQIITAGADAIGSDPLILKFERFQRSTGVLQIESNFKVDSVQLEILEDGKLRAKSEAKLGVTQ